MHLSKNKNRKFDVEIYDQRYSVVLNDSVTEAEVRRLADEVDTKMRQISDSTGIADSLKVAILAALHMAHERQEMKQRTDKAESALNSKTREWSRALDQVLGK